MSRNIVSNKTEMQMIKIFYGFIVTTLNERAAITTTNNQGMHIRIWKKKNFFKAENG